MPALGTAARARRVSGEPPWLRRYTIWVFGLVVALLFGRWMLERLFGFLITILLSLFLGFAIEPIVDRFARHGWRRGAATLLVYAVIAVIVTGFIVLVGSLVVTQTTGLVKSGSERPARRRSQRLREQQH